MIDATTNNLVELVKDNFPKGLLKEVASLPGRLDDAVLKRFLIHQPAVYFAFVGGRSSLSGSDARIDANWVSYVVTDPKDSARSPGPDTIMDALIPLLHDHTVPDVGTLICTRIDNLFSISKDKKGARIHAITLTIPNFSFNYQVDMSKLENFAIYHAEHSMAEGDAEPSAADEINLPQ